MKPRQIIRGSETSAGLRPVPALIGITFIVELLFIFASDLQYRLSASKVRDSTYSPPSPSLLGMRFSTLNLSRAAERKMPWANLP
jgi:hypothetical protein